MALPGRPAPRRHPHTHMYPHPHTYPHPPTHTSTPAFAPQPPHRMARDAASSANASGPAAENAAGAGTPYAESASSPGAPGKAAAAAADTCAASGRAHGHRSHGWDPSGEPPMAAVPPPPMPPPPPAAIIFARISFTPWPYLCMNVRSIWSFQAHSQPPSNVTHPLVATQYLPPASQDRHRSITGASQGGHRSVTGTSQGRHRSVTGGSQERYRGVASHTTDARGCKSHSTSWLQITHNRGLKLHTTDAHGCKSFTTTAAACQTATAAANHTQQ
eukprot:350158-Chlamydomonas_euryale.AAC.2